MTPKRLAAIQKVLSDIADDMKNDASTFDGKPFNGRTVAEYFGNQGAAIAAIARIVSEALAPPPGQEQP